MKRNNKKGFTLVELVIVIAVIAILAAVLIPTFGGIIEKANNSADLQEARNTFSEALIEDTTITQGTVYVQVGKDGNKYVKFTDGAPVDDDKDGNYTNESIPENLVLYSDKDALAKIYKEANSNTNTGNEDDEQTPTDPVDPDGGNDDQEELRYHYICITCPRENENKYLTEEQIQNTINNAGVEQTKCPDCTGAVFPCRENGCAVYTPGE